MSDSCQYESWLLEIRSELADMLAHMFDEHAGKPCDHHGECILALLETIKTLLNDLTQNHMAIHILSNTIKNKLPEAPTPQDWMFSINPN